MAARRLSFLVLPYGGSAQIRVSYILALRLTNVVNAATNVQDATRPGQLSTISPAGLVDSGELQKAGAAAREFTE